MIDILVFFLEKLITPSYILSFSDISDHKTCIICCNDFCKNSTIYKLDCGHIFDKNCILEWSRYSDFCPVCRSDFGTPPKLEY